MGLAVATTARTFRSRYMCTPPAQHPSTSFSRSFNFLRPHCYSIAQFVFIYGLRNVMGWMRLGNPPLLAGLAVWRTEVVRETRLALFVSFVSPSFFISNFGSDRQIQP